MDINLAKALKDVCEGATIYHDYSGRFMYGEKTTGLVVQSLTTLLKSVIENADCFVYEEGIPIYNKIEHFLIDEMGHDVILY
jgi:hypothetical protein